MPANGSRPPTPNTAEVIDPTSPTEEAPDPQYLDASRVVSSMAVFGRGRVTELTAPRILVLAVLAGGFITTGALFSVLLGTGIETYGTRKLIEGFAFSAGFFFVVLSEAVLFTEANVVLPATLLSQRRIWPRVLRFWALAWLGNLAGAWLFGQLIAVAQLYPPPDVLASLGETVETKMANQQLGGARTGAGWCFPASWRAGWWVWPRSLRSWVARSSASTSRCCWP
jgi:formate transporter